MTKTIMILAIAIAFVVGTIAIGTLASVNLAEAEKDKVKVLIGLKHPDKISIQDIEDIKEKKKQMKEKMDKVEVMIKSKGGKVSKNFHPFIDVIAVSVAESDIEEISKDPNVLYIEEDAIATTQGHSSSDPEYQNSWGVDHIDADVVASNGNKGSGIKVAVLDSGIDYNHVDLNDNYVVGGFDYVNNDSDPFDDYWHGTHVAGAVAAEKNGVGVVGTGPEISVYAVKVLDSNGFGFYSDIIAGIQWSSDNVDIASMSFGGTSGSQALQDAVTQAYNKGLLMVAAAGNKGGGGNSILFPAKYSEVIAVGATYPNDNRASFSSTGSQLELMAPGDDIRSTYPGDLYVYASGTSMATPHVSGSAALVMNSDETCWESLGYANGDGIWTNTEVRTVLDNTADDLGDPGHDSKYGYGLVDPDEAAQECSEVKFLEIKGDSATSSTTTYQVIVSGQISLGPKANPNDILSSDGTTINGRVLPTGRDNYYFTGDIVSITAGKHVFSFVDGVEVPNDSPIGKFLEIKGDPLTSSATTYQVIVSGQISLGPKANPNDILSSDGTTINGKILPTGLDNYYFTGDIVSITAGQHVFSFVDGVEVTNDSLA